MKKPAYAISALLLLALVAARAFWPRPVRLDDLTADPVAALYKLPGVTSVTRSGPSRPVRRVIHVLDYHSVPDDLARADGHDPEKLALAVDRVQQQQAGVFEQEQVNPK